MLELVVALKLLTQQAPLADHAARFQQNPQLRAMQIEAAATPKSATPLSSRERQELRAACERFVAEQPSKVIDLRKAQ
jgi:hypothetical protein